MKDQNKLLTLFGFSFERGGAHTSRTMMFTELETLLSYLNPEEADKITYQQAIQNDNCLGKRSTKTRMLTYRHLVDLYSLDSNLPLFRTLLYFWKRDPFARPFIALLCAYCRDSVLRSATPFVLSFKPEQIVHREALETFIDNLESGRFSPATLKSTAQNINATLTQSGHLQGRAKKIRTSAQPTSGSVAYALYLGYLNGVRGMALLQTEYVKLLDCPIDKILELAEEASRKGWIVLKRVGNVIEIVFPNLILPAEMEWLHEQNQTAYSIVQ